MMFTLQKNIFFDPIHDVIVGQGLKERQTHYFRMQYGIVFKIRLTIALELSRKS